MYVRKQMHMFELRIYAAITRYLFNTVFILSFVYSGGVMAVQYTVKISVSVGVHGEKGKGREEIER